ncbi:hypothetical protein [Bradyrhizobium amphicarpaeae]|uniref:Lipoprotein n=1 Tax=Bradyrhizobium amphicarpaeae TaxID=1404768 RepID=A0A2U8PVW3_9BRAD|nr:hypothetical protein [Bradyrhizobium amphicarpaeae]AWM01751.1 hypothetical protein CIT40_18055 [Bradyrhizobium amphicarpaeae]
MSIFKVVALCAVAAAVSGCAGRAPAPVSVVQPQDRYMDCAAVTIEVQTNNAKVQQLASDKGLKVAQNVAAGVAGLVVPVLWFGMDFQGTADTEIQALQARQQYLGALAEQRHCGDNAGEPDKVVAESPKKPRAKPKAPPPVPTAQAAPPPAEQK